MIREWTVEGGLKHALAVLFGAAKRMLELTADPRLIEKTGI